MKSRILMLALALVMSVAACGPRQVEVTTGPERAVDVSAATDASIRLTNNLSQAVNLYVTSGGTDIFLKQVGASTAEVVPVRGLPAGTTVALKARTVDGTRTYTRNNVYLGPAYEWRVP